MQLPTHQAGFQKYDKVCWNLAIVLEKMIILVMQTHVWLFFCWEPVVTARELLSLIIVLEITLYFWLFVNIVVFRELCSFL